MINLFLTKKRIKVFNDILVCLRSQGFKNKDLALVEKILEGRAKKGFRYSKDFLLLVSYVGFEDYSKKLESLVTRLRWFVEMFNELEQFKKGWGRSTIFADYRLD